MINIFYLVLSVVLTFVLLTYATRFMNVEYDYSIIACFLIIIYFSLLGVQIYFLMELFKHFNVSYRLENIYMIAFLAPIFLLECLYFKYILIKTNIPNKEIKILKSLEKFTLWNNKMFQNGVATLMMIGSLYFAISLVVSKPVDTKINTMPVQLIGIEYTEGCTDDRNTLYEDEYKFKFKYLDEINQSETISNDNLDKETLKKYYEILKNNFEGIFDAKVEITEYSDGLKSYTIKEILLD